MKKLSYVFYLVFACVFCSCEEKMSYPRYSLDAIEYVPDSLKSEYNKWVQETIKAASQHMTGGDYEDVDETIWAAKNVADELFRVKELGLRKEINDQYWDDFYILPIVMTIEERQIFDSLRNAR